MHIALLTETYPPDVGGLAVSAARLARLLSEAGITVHVMTLDATRRRGSSPQSVTDTLIMHRLAPRRRQDDTLTDWFDYLVTCHQQTPFDLLHAYFITQAGFVATYAGRYLGRPVVVSARGNDLERAVFDPARAAHVLYALAHASAITANARSLVRKAQALAPGRAVTLIPNGVDSSHFTPAAARRTLWPDPSLAGRSILGFVGEARAKKGLAVLLLAYQQVAQQRPVALVLLGGVRAGADQELLNVFRQQHPQLPLLVLPAVSHADLPDYYRQLDLLVLPSLRDGLPNALLEGMACGCAIVASAVGGIPDALHDGVHGRLVAPGNVDALAAAIIELLDDHELRHYLGQQARSHVEQLFTEQQERDANVQLYTRLLTVQT